jgi:prepilin-type N-terminal cleavage/methylation domain-containing protein
MKCRSNNKGFTLVDLMIVVAIMGLLGALISSLLLTGTKGWLYNVSSFQLKQKIKDSRDIIINDIRYARAYSVAISRSHTAAPAYSMITFVDVTGNARSFFQEEDRLVSSFQRPGESLTRVDMITSDLARFHVIFPDSKDFTKIQIAIGVSRIPFNDAQRPIEIDLFGSVDLHNQ